MDRIFYTDEGRLYKAPQPKNPSHAEMNFPNDDILKALTSTPITREEMIAKINHPEFDRIEAVLAPTVPTPKAKK